MVLGALNEGAAIERDDAGHGGLLLVGHVVACAGPSLGFRRRGGSVKSKIGLASIFVFFFFFN
jgi:hypothetical protein